MENKVSFNRIANFDAFEEEIKSFSFMVKDLEKAYPHANSFHVGTCFNKMTYLLNFLSKLPYSQLVLQYAH